MSKLNTFNNEDIVKVAKQAIKNGQMVKMGEPCNGDNRCFDCIIEELVEDCEHFYDHAIRLLASNFPDYA